LATENREAPRRARVIRRQELTLRHFKTKRIGECGPYTIYSGASLAAKRLHLGVSLHQGVGLLHIGRATQRLRVFNGQRTYIAQRTDRAAHGLRLARSDADDVGAELSELRHHE